MLLLKCFKNDLCHIIKLCLRHSRIYSYPETVVHNDIRILPISDNYLDYADKVAAQYKEAGLRVEVDSRSEKIGYKIREAQLEKVPYMLIVGEKEQAENLVSVRSRSEGELGQMSVEDFCKRAIEEKVSKVIK